VQTSSISYRVADFLGRYPPFQFFDEARRLELASNGRVKFHESDEYVFRGGEKRGGWVWVIQQGKVELLDQQGGLRDVLGEGDVLGIGAFLGTEVFLHTARTASDVILYAFPIEDFNRLVRSDSRATLFLASYFSVREDPMLAAAASSGQADYSSRPLDAVWIRESSDLHFRAARRLATIPRGASIGDGSKLLAGRREEALVLVDSDDRPTGLVSRRSFVEGLAAGLDGGAPLEEIARPLAVLPDSLEVGAYVLEMMHRGVEYLGLNASGSEERPLDGVVTASDVALLFGRNPAQLHRRILDAEDAGAVAELAQDATGLVLDTLEDRTVAPWLGDVSAELNRALLTRCAEIAAEAIEAEGLEKPEADFAWVFFGSAGRRELLTRVELDFGLVHEDTEPSERTTALRYFRELSRRVVRLLERCGFTFSARSVRPTEAQWRRSVSGWQGHYEGWVERPVQTGIYYGRPFFDPAPAGGRTEVLDRLVQPVNEMIAANPDFVRVLAIDSLARVPALGFYQGLVVDDTGEETDRLDLRSSVLYPLTDAARAFALLDGFESGQSTFDRLEKASQRFPEKLMLFEEAAEAHKVALYHRARAGLHNNSDGGVVHVSALSKLEQQLLKTSFRAILELLEFAQETFRSEKA